MKLQSTVWLQEMTNLSCSLSFFLCIPPPPLLTTTRTPPSLQLRLWDEPPPHSTTTLYANPSQNSPPSTSLPRLLQQVAPRRMNGPWACWDAAPLKWTYPQQPGWYSSDAHFSVISVYPWWLIFVQAQHWAPLWVCWHLAWCSIPVMMDSPLSKRGKTDISGTKTSHGRKFIPVPPQCLMQKWNHADFL